MPKRLNFNVTNPIARLVLLVATCLAAATASAQSAASGLTQSQRAEAANTPVAHGGSQGDFDFLVGAWTTAQRRLKARGVGSTEWRDSPPNVHCARRYLDGGAIVEESYSPTNKVAGLFLYLFEADKRQWSLYWIDPKEGKLDSPLVGAFDGDHGEFFGDDVEDERPIKVRYSWTRKDKDHARWEQAFSFSGGRWEKNWITEFTRTDAATACKAER